MPWNVMFAGGSSPHLVMADSSMSVMRFLDWFPLSVSIYANRSFLAPPAGMGPGMRDIWEQMTPKAYTSVVDARLAAGYAALATSAGRRPVVRYARDLQLSEFHLGENLILLGSASANPWVELFEDQLDFRIVLDPVRGFTVHDRHPRAGEPATREAPTTSGKTGEAWATLSLVNGLDGRGRVLIAQGTSMEGTEVAGNLALTRSEELARVLRQCGVDPGGTEGRFEILLRLDATGGSASRSQIVTARCGARP
jgi:hypothetical protein